VKELQRQPLKKRMFLFKRLQMSILQKMSQLLLMKIKKKLLKTPLLQMKMLLQIIFLQALLNKLMLNIQIRSIFQNNLMSLNKTSLNSPFLLLMLCQCKTRLITYRLINKKKRLEWHSSLKRLLNSHKNRHKHQSNNNKLSQFRQNQHNQ